MLVPPLQGGPLSHGTLGITGVTGEVWSGDFLRATAHPQPVGFLPVHTQPAAQSQQVPGTRRPKEHSGPPLLLSSPSAAWALPTLGPRHGHRGWPFRISFGVFSTAVAPTPGLRSASFRRN